MPHKQPQPCEAACCTPGCDKPVVTCELCDGTYPALPALDACQYYDEFAIARTQPATEVVVTDPFGFGWGGPYSIPCGTPTVLVAERTYTAPAYNAGVGVGRINKVRTTLTLDHAVGTIESLAFADFAGGTTAWLSRTLYSRLPTTIEICELPYTGLIGPVNIVDLGTFFNSATFSNGAWDIDDWILAFGFDDIRTLTIA